MATIPENPITRRETYLAKIAGQNVQLPDAPLTREETYLDAIAKKGGGGSLPTGALKLKGRVDSFAQLPTAGNEDGDVYIVGLPTATEKSEYYWFNDRWNYLGETPIDLSAYQLKAGAVGAKHYVNGVAKGEIFNHYGSNKASEMYSHAEGYNTTASSANSHAEGNSTTASGVNSHAEGNGTNATFTSSHAEGYYTTTSASYQHVQGKYNSKDASAAFIIGNGTDDDHRSNALKLDWDGNLSIAGELKGMSGNSLLPDTSELVKKTDRATATVYGLTKYSSQIQIDEEINGITSITPKQIPRIMSNYNIDKTTINRTNDIIGYRQKNLLKLDYEATFISHGVTAVCNGDGSITFNGTADADTVIIWSLPNKNAVSSFENVKYFKNGEYIKGGLGSKANLQWVEYNTSSNVVVTNSNSAKVINNSYAYNTIRIVVPNGSTFDNETMYPYVYYSNETDLTYEPYKKDINTRLTAIETSPMMNEVIISASEYANIDVNDYPTGTRFMIWDDSSLNTPSVQTLSIAPMMSGFALSEETGEEMEEVEGDTLNSLQTANNLRFADTLTETSLDIEEGDSE